MDCYLAGAETESSKVHSTVHGREHGKTSEFYEDGPNDAIHWLMVESLNRRQRCVEYYNGGQEFCAPWMVVLAEALHAGKANLIHSSVYSSGKRKFCPLWDGSTILSTTR